VIVRKQADTPVDAPGDWTERHPLIRDAVA
jgi:hypothetical protein